MIKHRNIKSKMKKTEALLDHPFIAQHIPETVWYDSLILTEMLERHKVVYIKPNTGVQGNKIIRALKINGFGCVLSYDSIITEIPLSFLPLELGTIMVNRKYLIQQGVDLATYNNRPFDIRMIMQKPYTTWQLTLTSAKVAAHMDAVVTNVAKGGQTYPLTDILQKYDQRRDPMTTMKEVVDLAHQICSVLGAKFPFRIIGLDMAVDKKSRVWFIEANTIPICTHTKAVSHISSQQKFEEAKKIIETDSTTKNNQSDQDNPAQPRGEKSK